MRAALLIVALAASGCSSLAPEAVRGERANLNVALQWTSDEQLLLNLVRLRYRDTPAFLEVSSISTQSRLETTLELGAELPRRAPDTLSLSAGAGYWSQPTLTYTPLQGENFATRLLSPLALEKLVLLNQSGWNIRRLFRVAVQRVNGLGNAPRASGPAPEESPEFEPFGRVIQLLRRLERQDAIKLGYESYPAAGVRPRVVLEISPDAQQSRDVQELLSLLRLTPGKRHYPLVFPLAVHAIPGAGDMLVVETRSVLGMLYFLAQAVEVPEEDQQASRVAITRDDAGALFDWKRVLGDSFSVRSRSAAPEQAAIGVRYRGHWFYIDDTDLESKATFSMLSQIFALQAGKSEAVVPVLTLPIGK